MRPRFSSQPLLPALAAIAAIVLVAWVMRQLSFVSVGLAANEESRAVLEKRLEELKMLSRLDPAHEALYRRRFEETQRLLNHLEIVNLSRRQLTRRVELVLLAVVAAIIVAGVMLYIAGQRRRARRMAGLYLEHIASWQEAARRHAHEMRTPLTTARMEVTSLVRWMAPRLDATGGEELQRRQQSIVEELERLRRFTSNFVAFASLPAPSLKQCDLGRLAEEFCELFAPNWPRLALRVKNDGSRVCANADASMIRQVLVNLCNNSALALDGQRSGTVTFSVAARGAAAVLDVADDGPGIAPELRRRLFEPYTTTRKIGEGMGLGLAISKKILLDHGGDLELIAADRGARFRLTLPRVEC